jgi:3'-5' exonuclease
MNILAFDIETIPDTEAGRRIHGLDGLSDADVARAMAARRRMQTGESEFLPLHLHRVVAISTVLRHGDTFRVWSLGAPDAPEEELLRRFFAGIERYTPTLVSWNGGGFDLPVLHYRSLRHGVAAPRYWDMGDDDSAFRWNNYLNRFHLRHTDLMDVLGGYQPRGSAPLHEIALILGLPGKLGMDGAAVWPRYQAGDIEAIRDYCEVDALNTYLVYLRWQLLRGQLSDKQWGSECDLVRAALGEDGRAHLAEFLAAWQETQ